MSTWHQTKSGSIRLDYPGEWTVCTDPPNALRTATSFALESSALEYLAKFGGKHSYIIPPRKVTS